MARRRTSRRRYGFRRRFRRYRTRFRGYFRRFRSFRPFRRFRRRRSSSGRGLFSGRRTRILGFGVPTILLVLAVIVAIWKWQPIKTWVSKFIKV
ncbi:hypothetical protein SAMN05444362_102344 [Dysgonomonas macrotermitis]|uniref:Uncharacterized protein n=1 Tax=Dysgonomonas macrotermitis TaxID=1346286 RepID=A0A1M4WX86_9BACT|nr:hypothetical protein SAMN05444362_102344 [Dysgonomonas macrotermitis]